MAIANAVPLMTINQVRKRPHLGESTQDSPNRIREILLTPLRPQLPGLVTPLIRRLAPELNSNGDILPEVPELALMRILHHLTNLQRLRLRPELEIGDLSTALLDDRRDVVERFAAVREFDGPHGIRVAGVADAGVDVGGGGVAVG